MTRVGSQRHRKKNPTESTVNPKTKLGALNKRKSIYICPELNKELPAAKLRALPQYATLADDNKRYMPNNISYWPHLEIPAALS